MIMHMIHQNKDNKAVYLIVGAFLLLLVLYALFSKSTSTLRIESQLYKARNHFVDLQYPPPFVPEVPRFGYRNYSESVKIGIAEAITYSGNFSRIPEANVKPFVSLKAYYKLAPEYYLGLCDIEMSTPSLMTPAFCYLFNTANFLRSNRTMDTEWKQERKFCTNRNDVWLTRSVRRLLPGPHTMVYFVRDPIDRFISTFLRKCSNLRGEHENCYDCKGDFDCVIRAAHAQMQDYGSGRRTLPVYPETVPYEARHFAPQTWYCDLMDRYESYAFIQYASRGVEKQQMFDYITDIMKEHKVPEYKLWNIQKVITDSDMTHYADYLKKSDLLNTISTNAEYKRMLNEMYEFDYQIFNFTRIN